MLEGTSKDLKNAKRYKLQDLELDDTFYDATVMPYEQAFDCFQKINKEYSIMQLRIYLREILAVLGQDYAAIEGSCHPRELVDTCYHMLLYNLIEEETVFYNTIGLMLQALERLILPPEDNNIGPVFKKVFALLLKILKSIDLSQMVILES